MEERKKNCTARPACQHVVYQGHQMFDLVHSGVHALALTPSFFIHIRYVGKWRLITVRVILSTTHRHTRPKFCSVNRCVQKKKRLKIGG